MLTKQPEHIYTSLYNSLSLPKLWKLRGPEGLQCGMSPRNGKEKEKTLEVRTRQEVGEEKFTQPHGSVFQTK